MQAAEDLTRSFRLSLKHLHIGPYFLFDVRGIYFEDRRFRIRVIQQLPPLTMFLRTRERKEVLFPVDIEHAVEISAMEAATCSVYCFERCETVE